MTRLLNLAVWTSVLLGSAAVMAMPAPMDDEELTALSDIVVDAEVIDVECVGLVEVPGEIKQVKLRSTHQVLTDHLGGAPSTFHIDFFVDLMDVPIAGCAWREPPHWVGERAKLWLSEAAEAGDVYALFNWSGIQMLDDNASIAMTEAELNACAMDTEPTPGPGGGTGTPADGNNSSGSGGCSLTSSSTPTTLGIAAFGLIFLMMYRRRQTVQMRRAQRPRSADIRS